MTQAQQLNDLTIDRTYDAPIDRVWRAWTDPNVLERWYCPNPDREITVDMDLRVGGDWRVMMGPDGCSGSYLAVDEPRRLEFTWAWDGSEDVPTTVEVLLEEVAGGTRVTLSQRGFESADECRGHTEGWSMSLDRLKAELT